MSFEKEIKGLEDKQDAVGGLIELYTLEDGTKVWFNENGYNLDLKENFIASFYLGFKVVGNVLFQFKSEDGYDKLFQFIASHVVMRNKVSNLESSLLSEKGY